MAFRGIVTPIIVEDDAPARGAADYAVRLAAITGARLHALIAAPRIPLAGALMLPAARAMIDDANAARRGRAEQLRIDLAAIASGAMVDCEIIVDRYLDVRARMVAAARMSDLVVLEPAPALMETSHDVMRALLFQSGRPLLLVPAGWTEAPSWRRIVVAWDGGAPSARALGDAMPFIEQAESVEIVTVTPDPHKAFGAASIGAHVARHCHATRVTELPARDGDIGKTIREHARMTRADLVVMGAFGHARLWEQMLGGVTSDAIANLTTPTLTAH